MGMGDGGTAKTRSKISVILMVAKQPEDPLLVLAQQKQVLRSLRSHQDDILRWLNSHQDDISASSRARYPRLD